MNNKFEERSNNMKHDVFKNKKFKITLISIVSTIMAIVLSVGGYGYYQLNQVKYTSISKTDVDLGISNKSPSEDEIRALLKEKRPDYEQLPDEMKVEMDENIVNIALFGVDRRDQTERGRSDSIMIATIDKKHNKIKLTSFMRDTYVNIKGHGMDKINHAYSLGGPQLAIKTINENFKMDIRDYVMVDFFGLEKIIQAFGGITMDIKPEEIPDLNYYIQELADIEGVEAPLITEPGEQLLNGIQAVTYGRIRHTGNGDYERTDRQRRVLNALFEKVQEGGPIKYPFLVSQLLPYTETSMKRSDIIMLGAQVFTANISTLEQLRLPLEDASEGIFLEDIWYLWADITANTKYLHQFIYEDKTPKVMPGDLTEQKPRPEPKPEPQPAPTPATPVAPTPDTTTPGTTTPETKPTEGTGTTNPPGKTNPPITNTTP